MKQYVFATLCALLISFQLFSQNIVLPENMINFLKEDFNHEESCFPSLTTIDNYFIVNNGDYLMSRNNAETEYAVLVSNENLIDVTWEVTGTNKIQINLAVAQGVANAHSITTTIVSNVTKK